MRFKHQNWQTWWCIGCADICGRDTYSVIMIIRISVLNFQVENMNLQPLLRVRSQRHIVPIYRPYVTIGISDYTVSVLHNSTVFKIAVQASAYMNTHIYIYIFTYIYAYVCAMTKMTRWYKSANMNGGATAENHALVFFLPWGGDRGSFVYQREKLMWDERNDRNNHPFLYGKSPGNTLYNNGYPWLFMGYQLRIDLIEWMKSMINEN